MTERKMRFEKKDGKFQGGRFQKLSYNEILKKLHESDFVIGMRHGEIEILQDKRNYLHGFLNSDDKFDRGSLIEIVINLFRIETGVNFFDDACEQELIKVMSQVFKKYSIEMEAV